MQSITGCMHAMSAYKKTHTKETTGILIRQSSVVEIFGYLKYAFKVFVPLSFLSSLYFCKRIMKHPKEKPGVDNKQLLEFQTFLDPRRRGFMTREWNYSLISYLTSPRLDGPQRPDSHSCNRKKKIKKKPKPKF